MTVAIDQDPFNPISCNTVSKPVSHISDTYDGRDENASPTDGAPDGLVDRFSRVVFPPESESIV